MLGLLVSSEDAMTGGLENVTHCSFFSSKGCHCLCFVNVAGKGRGRISNVTALDVSSSPSLLAYNVC